jgi:hypothetical protein
MLQEYVVNVSDECCSKLFLLQVFHEQTREVGATEVVPSDVVVPACTGSEASMVAPTCMCSSSRCMLTAATGGPGPACAAAAKCVRASRSCMYCSLISL